MNNSVKILHTADWHLGAAFSYLSHGKRQTRKTELLLTTEKILNICQKNEIPLLLLSGDVFDSNSVDADTVSAFLGSVRRHSDTRVVISAGNHDPLTADSPFLCSPLPENLYIFGTNDECIYFEDIGVRVYGKSFKNVYMQSSERFSLIPPTDDIINIMVLHGDTAADSNYNGITPEFIRNSGMDYIALGHVHTFSGIKQLDSVYYAYPGCPEPHGFDETGEMGVICAVVSKGKVEHQFVPTAARRHETVRIDIGAASDNAAAAEIIKTELRSRFGGTYDKNLYKIILCGEIRENVNISTDEILGRLTDDVFFAKMRNETRFSVDLQSLSLENTLKGKFVKAMLERISAEQGNKALESALNIGLGAFFTEVKYDEN